MIQTKSYPKVHNKLKIFVKELLITWIEQATGGDPEEIHDEHLEGSIAPLLQSNIRLLYEFLDLNHVYLQPILLEQLNPEAGWGFEISHPGGNDDENAKYNTRKEAELAGFIKSFKILEDLL